MHTLAAFLFSLPLAALAGTHSPYAHRRRSAHWQKSDDAPLARRNTAYHLQQNYTGEALLDGWDFFTGADPTDGIVNFLDRKTAQSKGLAVVQDDGIVRLSVDSTTQLQSGQLRDSVRIQTKQTFNGGLFIADFFSMPHGCSVWPAYWSVGPNWPYDGEIDLIEGVNLQVNNQITAHTGNNCVLGDVETATAHLINDVCTSTPSSNAGCAFSQPTNASFGHQYNMQGGGVMVHEWTDDAISVWSFPRNAIPQDITAGAPNPSSWGPPTALFPSSSGCDVPSNFKDHKLVIDTTLCGGWAGDAFSGDGCPGTCQDFVADPKNFAVAHWTIASILVYQPAGN